MVVTPVVAVLAELLPVVAREPTLGAELTPLRAADGRHLQNGRGKGYCQVLMLVAVNDLVRDGPCFWMQGPLPRSTLRLPLYITLSCRTGSHLRICNSTLRLLAYLRQRGTTSPVVAVAEKAVQQRHSLRQAAAREHVHAISKYFTKA